MHKNVLKWFFLSAENLGNPKKYFPKYFYYYYYYCEKKKQYEISTFICIYRMKEKKISLIFGVGLKLLTEKRNNI